MNTQLHKLVLLCLTLLIAWAQAASAVELSAASAVNKAGRQRMLSQRIVKAYCQIGLGITPQLSKAQLSDAVQLFDAQLAELKPFAVNHHGETEIAKLEKSWRPVKATATAPVDRDNVKPLQANSEQLLDAAQQLTEALQKASHIRIGRLVNISGRQRMLSQRLAKLYMLRAWGLDLPTLRSEIATAKTEFDGALQTLQAAAENTPALKQELAAVAMQWEWFQSALSQEGAFSYGLLVANASESILNSMELITDMYERLPEK